MAPTCNCSNLSTKQQMYVKLAEICSRIQKQTLFIEKGHCFIDLVKSCCDALYSLQDVEVSIIKHSKFLPNCKMATSHGNMKVKKFRHAMMWDP